MIRLLLPLFFLIALPLQAADPCVSGVPVGQRPGPYSFLVATGPQRGQPTCYICEQGDKPSAIVFARKLSDPLGKLLGKLDAETATSKEKGFKAWMTQLADKADLDALGKWSQKQGLKSIPVGAFEDADGPPAYKLNQSAEVTVLLFVKEKVVANYAFRSGELNDKAIAEVMKAVPALFQEKPAASSTPAQKKADPEKDPEKIQKKLFAGWEIVSGENEGVPLRKEDLDYAYEFNAKQSWFMETVRELSQHVIGRAVVDVKADPMRLDLYYYDTEIYPKRTRVTPGIFKSLLQN